MRSALAIAIVGGLVFAGGFYLGEPSRSDEGARAGDSDQNRAAAPRAVEPIELTSKPPSLVGFKPVKELPTLQREPTQDPVSPPTEPQPPPTNPESPAPEPPAPDPEPTIIID